MFTTHEILLCLSLKYKGNWDEIYQAIRNKKRIAEEEGRDLLASYKSDAKVVVITDPDYPEALKKIYRPPFVLFYYGDFSSIKNQKHCVSYIGSRDSSAYGEKMAKEISSGLAKKGYVIVSGMAKGIDGVATKAALDAGGRAVGILGSGIDVCYPNSNEDIYKRLKTEGLLLSEYPEEVPPNKENFPARNRLIAGLSEVVVVGEADRHSGTLITVNYALEGGKEVACLPYPADQDSACNLLIKDGATLITSAEDVLEML